MSKNDFNKNKKILLESKIQRINEFFDKYQYLEKQKLSEFFSYIELPFITQKQKDLEKLWLQLSKNSSKDKITKDILVQNLSEYINSNKNDTIKPEESLKNSVFEFISNPKKLNINIDPDNDDHFELYRLLASLQYIKDNMVQINFLEKQLNNLKFINLNKESMELIIDDLVKEKINYLKKEQLMIILEEMGKKFGNILEEKSNTKKVFTEEELIHAELNEFDDIDSIIKILFNNLNSINFIHTKYCECIQNKDTKNLDDLNRYYKIFINNQKLFLYEINRIYNFQKQKFNFYECHIENKNILYKQKISQLNEEIKRQKEIEEMANFDNLKALNEEIIKEKNKYQNLENEIKLIKIDNQKKVEEQILSENKIMSLEKNIQEKQNKINSLKKENELMSEKYKEVLDTLNNQLYYEKEKERHNDEIYKNMNLNEKQKLLLNKKKEDLIAYIVEKDNYCLTLENKNKNLIEKISQLEKNADDMDKDFYELKSKVLTLENKNSILKKENEDFQKLVDEYQNKNAVYLSNLLEENDNNENNEKKFNYIEVKNIQFNYKKIKNDINKRNYDFLCLKLNAQILENLKDKYFNANSNLFFSELINYLDEDKQTTECALFITSEYLYFFNSITFSMGFSIQIDELKTVFISPLNNYVSMTFYEGETINFELFRILDLMNFIKSLNALHKTKIPIEININDYNNQFVCNHLNNFTICAYHGRAIFSGYVNKRVEGFLKSGFEKRFASLTEIGLVVMNEPNGKPLNIINLLFAKMNIYNGGDGDYCFCINIGSIKHTFSVESDFIRKKWIEEINKWIKKIKDEESIMI